MLKVKVRVGKSKIHCWGLFADEFIKKGTITWEYSPKLDISIPKKKIESMSKLNKDYIYKYAYFDKKLHEFVLCADDQRFINHSQNPKKRNIKSSPRRDIACKNIKSGEELLCDYFKFDPDYFKRHGILPEELI